MHFAFTEEQDAVRVAVRDLLTKECTSTEVRCAWDAPSGRIEGLWDKLSALGMPLMIVPESAGGLGLTMIDLVGPLEETGWAALPEPIVEHAAVAAPLVSDVGDRVSSALLHDGFVPYAGSVDMLLLAHGDELHLVELDRVARGQLTLTERTSVDGARRLFEAKWSASSATLVGGRDELEAARDRGTIGVAAQLCGLAARMLTMTVDYAKERRQFGAPIGSFQAVKHHLADARVALEFARPLVYRAAYSSATADQHVSLHASMAKAQASEAALRAGRVALQCHGAIAYTVEYDLHLYLKRTWALARAWGDAPTHRARVGDALHVLAEQSW